jgi:Holliday junction resolvase
MKQPETHLVTKIRERLQAEGGWWVKIHGGPFQQAGIPDIIGCYKGRFIGIEVKLDYNKPSGLQQLVLSELTKAGARCGVAYSVQQALNVRDGIENWSVQKENYG